MNQLIVVNNGIEKQQTSYPGINIQWIGENGKITIYEPARFINCIFRIGTNSSISIGKDSFINNLFICCDATESLVVLNSHFICNGGKFILARGMKHQKILIGKNCLLSSSIAFYTSDGHALIDSKTNKCINLSGGNITIGNHCWIGYNVTFLRNASIADDVVVGSCSLVTKKFTTSNCIIAGAPAKIVRENISWDISSPDEYSQRSQQNGN